jgi:hypothetical protein
MSSSCALRQLGFRGPPGTPGPRLHDLCQTSTEAYLRADPAEKLAVLGANTPLAIKAGKFRPPSDALIATLATSATQRKTRSNRAPRSRSRRSTHRGDHRHSSMSSGSTRMEPPINGVHFGWARSSCRAVAHRSTKATSV